MTKQVIILTCTVEPQTSKSISRNSTSIRLQDYLKAINFYLSTLTVDTKIIVVENSNSLDLIKRHYHSDMNIKFIQSPKDNISCNAGKSAGEFEMLKYLYKNGYLNEYDYVWKITGRLIIRNINKLMRQTNSDICAFRFRDAHSCDTRFFGMKTHIFARLVDQEINFDEKPKFNKDIITRTFQSIEYYLAFFCVRMSELGFSIKATHQIPVYYGYGASSGKKLHTVKARLFIFLTSKFRKLSLKILGSHLP